MCEATGQGEQARWGDIAPLAVVSADPRRMGGISTGRKCRAGKGRLLSECGGAGGRGVLSQFLSSLCADVEKLGK